MATELGSFIFIFHPHEVREANDSTYRHRLGGCNDYNDQQEGRGGHGDLAREESWRWLVERSDPRAYRVAV